MSASFYIMEVINKKHTKVCISLKVFQTPPPDEKVEGPAKLFQGGSIQLQLSYFDVVLFLYKLPHSALWEKPVG